MKRFQTLILILALMLAFTTSAFAQGNCGDLSAEDCDILYGSSDAMMAVTSGSQFIGVEIQAMNVPQTPIMDASFSWTLDTTYAYSDEAAEMSMAMMEMSAEEMADLYADPAALSDMVTSILAGTSASIDMTTDFSEEVVSLLSATAGADWPSSVVLSVVLDSGIAYLDLSTLEPLLGDMGMGGWIGIDILPWVEASLMQSATDPTTAMAASASTQTGAGPLFTQIAGVDMGMVTPFLNIERMDDADVDGEAVAVFSTTINWDAFVESPYFDQLIGLALAQTGAMPSEAEMEQTVTLARMFGPALLEGIVVELVEGVGLDTGYLVATDFVFDWDLSDLAALAAMTGGAALEVDEGAAIMASIVTTNTSVNEDVEIEVPADATIIPTEMLTGAMGQ
ncbi:hypothetical protein GC175_13015 [bacterium]|nr:hypothetical protein [bacterium]